MARYICFLSVFLSVSAFSQEWQPTYGTAVSLAQSESKPLILVFSGSDWCAPCIKLDRDIWQSLDFKEYAKDHYVLYRADFPRKKANQLSEDLQRTHRDLAERFNPKGHFPLVVVMDANEEVLGRTGYQAITPEAYISLLNSFR